MTTENKLENKIVKLLDELYIVKQAIVTEQQYLEDMIDNIIPDEIKEEIQGIKGEFEPKINGERERSGRMEKAIKHLAVAHGSTVRGRDLMAVPAAGRTTWNKDTLQALAIDNPSIWTARKIGKKSCSIREVKNGE